MALTVNEIFYSIQGESTFAGLPCVFVRLTGCNLRCSYCDTRYAYDEGRDRKINEIIEQVQTYHCSLIEITGGEPLLQDETPALVRGLLDKGLKVLMETNGSLDIRLVDDRCIRIIDIKCPSSGEHLKTNWKNLDRLTATDEIKFVIGTREDYEFARKTAPRLRTLKGKLNQIHFSPVFGQIDPRQLAGWILEDKINVRFHLQLHKIIWDADTRGV